MGISGIENSSLSEESKKALQSETWQKAREGIKARSEIKHFSEEAEAGNEYGPEWGAVVKEYFKIGYKAADKGCDLEVGGVIYKVLRRDKVTAFYDSDGDTLFDVTNERLTKEYESLEKGSNLSGEEKLTYEEQEESPENKPSIPEEDGEPEGNKGATGEAEHTHSAPAEISENAAAVKERAIKKLKDELKNSKDKSFADPIIKYLMGRCEDDKGLSEDILQKHKTWEKCLSYVYSLARKQANGNCAAVRDEVVYEWAEDYYHKDDKAEEAEKAKKAEEAKKKAAERAAKSKASTGKPKSENKAAQEKGKSPAPAENAEEKRTRRNNKDLEGQMDMFSMMGM